VLARGGAEAAAAAATATTATSASAAGSPPANPFTRLPSRLTPVRPRLTNWGH